MLIQFTLYAFLIYVQFSTTIQNTTSSSVYTFVQFGAFFISYYLVIV